MTARAVRKVRRPPEQLRPSLTKTGFINGFVKGHDFRNYPQTNR